MKLKPSWRRQCKATFQFDPISAKLIADIAPAAVSHEPPQSAARTLT
jgi:hypothetical protein